MGFCLVVEGPLIEYEDFMIDGSDADAPDETVEIAFGISDD